MLGTYPAMTLRAARDAADELYRQCREGKDPALTHRRRKLVGPSSGSTFESFALRWFEREKPHWRQVHAEDVLASLKRDIFPDLGSFPIDQIDRQLMLAVFKKVEARGATETAHRFFRTLHSPYLTNTGGNGRADAMALVQAASILEPGCLNVPVNDKGKSVYKLDRLAPLYGFAHANAHDALGDVLATIHLAKCVSERSPEIFNRFVGFATKPSVAAFLNEEPAVVRPSSTLIARSILWFRRLEPILSTLLPSLRWTLSMNEIGWPRLRRSNWRYGSQRAPSRFAG